MQLSPEKHIAYLEIALKQRERFRNNWASGQMPAQVIQAMSDEVDYLRNYINYLKTQTNTTPLEEHIKRTK